MKHFWRNERGNIMVVTAGAMAMTLAIAALVIDVSCLLTARNQLQSAVDAAALAGASGLLTSQSVSTSRAIEYAGRNTCINSAVSVGSGDVSFPTSSRIRVQGRHAVGLYFARIFNRPTATVTAAASAELANIVGLPLMRPFAVPEMPGMQWSPGDVVTIKLGDTKDPDTTPSWFYAVDFPPMNRGNPETGASAYRDNIMNGTPSTVGIGDVLQIEPGNMAGPTSQGVQDLMASDPNATYNFSTHTIENSNFSGTSSPRVVPLPLFDESNPPASGRSSITVTGIAAFFVIGMNGKEVMGVYMNANRPGQAGTGRTMIHNLKLVE